MSTHKLRRVMTPEEMGEYLGVSPERVAAVRAIMESPAKSNGSSSKSSHRNATRKAALKKAAVKKSAAKKAAKR